MKLLKTLYLLLFLGTTTVQAMPKGWNYMVPDGSIGGWYWSQSDGDWRFVADNGTLAYYNFPTEQWRSGLNEGLAGWVYQRGEYLYSESSGWSVLARSNTVMAYNYGTGQWESFSDPSSTLPAGINWVDIPGGTFEMGSYTIRGPLAADHTPVHMVEISAFRMSEAEITNEQYEEFLNAAMADGLIVVGEGFSAGGTATFVFGAEGQSFADKKLIELSGSRVLKDHDGDGSIDPESPLNRCWISYDEATQTFSIIDPQAIDWDAYPYIDGESRADWPELAEGNLPSAAEVSNWPATFIKWYGAKVFSDYYGCQLPTEAEWEYAAKGGVEHEYGTSNGTLTPTNANYIDSGNEHVIAVKSYAPNPFGLYDMSGNVWEWCEDWYDPTFYSVSPLVDPVRDTLVLGTTEPIEGPQFTGGPGQPYNGDARVKRGGSWNFHASALASASRERDYTWRGNDHFGFRIVRR